MDESTGGNEGASLHRTLGLWHGVSLYCGSVLGTGVLVLPAIAARTAGPASLLAWLGLIILSVPMALTYAAMSVQRPDAGGFSDAIERAFGPRWGAVAGWLFVSQVPVGTVVAALIAGESAKVVLGGGQGVAFASGAALVLSAYVLNYVGLKVSASAQFVTLAVITVGLAVIVGFALPSVEVRQFQPFFPHGTGAVGSAAVQLFWAFVGWEAITPLAREFKDAKEIRRASVIAVVVVAVVYLSLAVAVIGTGAHGDAPLVAMAGRVFGAQASRVVGIAGFLLCFIPVNAYVAGTSRLVFALGARRQLPPWLGTLSPSGTPRRALAAIGVAAMVSLTICYLAGKGISDLLPISAAAFISTYVLSMAAAMRLLPAPLSYGAAITLAVCALVLCFVGPLVLWVFVVGGASLLYTRRAGVAGTAAR